MRLLPVLILSLLLPSPASGFAQPQPDPAARARQAVEALRSGNVKEAVTIYQELVKALPEVPGLRMNLGIAHFLAEQYPAAIRELELAVRADPSLTGAWVHLGASHLEAGNLDEAVTALRHAVKREPGNPRALEIWRMLGDALLAVERFGEAVEQFQALSKMNPEDPKPWHGLVRSYESLSKEAFEQLDKMAPDSAYWSSIIGGNLLVQQRYQSAFSFFRKALEKQPGMRGIHAVLGQIYEKSGHPEWAAEERKKEEQLGLPDCTSVTIECHFLQGRFQQVLAAARDLQTPEACYWQVRACDHLAKQAFSRIQGLPPSAALHELMAEVHHQQGRDLESVSEWKKALELSPSNPTARKRLAEALIRIRDYDAARLMVDSLLREEPESVQLNSMAGDIRLIQRQPAEAIPFLTQALRSDPGHVRANASLGSAYLSIGEAARAIPHLESGLESDEDGSLYYQLARAYQRVGDGEWASQNLRKYQEIQKEQQARKEQFEKEIQITPPR